MISGSLKTLLNEIGIRM